MIIIMNQRVKQVSHITSFVVFFTFLINLTYGQTNENKLLERWEFSESELNSAESDYARGKGIKYYHFTFLSNGKKVNGYLAVPENLTNNPAILWNDGGSAKYFPFTAEQVPRKFGELVESGFVVVACNYKDESNGEVKDEFVKWFSICGPAAECETRLRQIIDLGLDHVYILGGSPVPHPHGERQAAMVAQARNFAEQVLPKFR